MAKKVVLLRGSSVIVDPTPVWGFAREGVGVTGGSTPFVVTNFTDNVTTPPAGSLRQALQTAGRRISFASDGQIPLAGDLAIPSNTTIDAGQRRVHTTNYRWFTSGQSNIIVRNMGSYPGSSSAANAQTLDCMGFTSCDRLLIDRCSLAFSKDECLDLTNCTRTSVQRCVLAWPLHLPPTNPHPSGRHALFGRLESAASGLGGISFVGNLLAFGSWRPNIFKKVQLVKNIVYGVNHGTDFSAGNPATFTASHPFNIVQTVDALTQVDILLNFFKESASAEANAVPERAVRVDTSITGLGVQWRMKNEAGVNENIFDPVAGADYLAPMVSNGFTEHPVLNFLSHYNAMLADPYFAAYDPATDAGPIMPDNVVLAVRAHYLSSSRTGVHANTPSDAIPGGLAGIL